MHLKTPIYTKRVWVNGVQREIPMTARGLDAAISNFAEMKQAFASFLFYVERVKADPTQHVPIDRFEAALVAATEKATGYGSLLWYRVWEELLNRHGIPTDWSGHRVNRS